MYTENEMTHMRELYRSIFGESADNSKEFTNFVQGNPTLLRIKLEEAISSLNEMVMNYNFLGTISDLRTKRDLMKELERIVMEFIENHYD